MLEGRNHSLNAISKNNPVKKTVNYWELWLPASYGKNMVLLFLK